MDVLFLLTHDGHGWWERGLTSVPNAFRRLHDSSYRRTYTLAARAYLPSRARLPRRGSRHRATRTTLGDDQRKLGLCKSGAHSLSESQVYLFLG